MMTMSPPQGGPPGGPGGGFAEMLRARMQDGGQPMQPGMGAPGGLPQAGALGQIPPQLLMLLLQMLLKGGGGGSDLMGGHMPPGVPPMNQMPNRPPGSM